MRLTRLHEDLGWGDAGVQDPGITPTTLPVDKGLAWQQLARRYKRGLLSIGDFLREAIAGLVAGIYDEDSWYEMGSMFSVDEAGMDEILSIANASTHPERKEQMLYDLISQSI